MSVTIAVSKDRISEIAAKVFVHKVSQMTVVPELLPDLIARSINVAAGPARPICKLATLRHTADQHTPTFIITLSHLRAYGRAKCK